MCAIEPSKRDKRTAAKALEQAAARNGRSYTRRLTVIWSGITWHGRCISTRNTSCKRGDLLLEVSSTGGSVERYDVRWRTSGDGRNGTETARGRSSRG